MELLVPAMGVMLATRVPSGTPSPVTIMPTARPRPVALATIWVLLTAWNWAAVKVSTLRMSNPTSVVSAAWERVSSVTRP